MFVLELGLNHLGNRKLLDKLINSYLKSTFDMATIMIHNSKYYIDNPRHVLNKSAYKKIINSSKKKKKKIGLAVCDVKTFKYLADLKFDFYKLLSIANIDEELINLLKLKKKHIYISTGLSNLDRIKKSINYFKNYKKITILHTPMTYEVNKLNFQMINVLKKKFNKKVGYSNHCNKINTLYALSAYNPCKIFLYLKPYQKNIFPDNQHAFQIDSIENIKENYIQCLHAHKYAKQINKTGIFAK